MNVWNTVHLNFVVSRPKTRKISTQVQYSLPMLSASITILTKTLCLYFSKLILNSLFLLQPVVDADDWLLIHAINKSNTPLRLLQIALITILFTLTH